MKLMHFYNDAAHFYLKNPHKHNINLAFVICNTKFIPSDTLQQTRQIPLVLVGS